MGLYREYTDEVTGFPQSPGVGYAYQVWTKHDPKYWEKIPYFVGAFPLPGDVVIWMWRYGGTGHIAIATIGMPNVMTCFSQNDPRGKRAILKDYNYGKVLGWLRPRTEHNENRS